MRNALLSVLTELESFQRLRNLINRERDGGIRKTALTTGVIDSQKCHLSCSLSCEAGRPIAVIASSELKAREIYQDILFFFPEPGEVLYYPAKDIIFYGADVKSADITKSRFEVISSLLNENNGLKAVVLSVEALFDRLTDKNKFKEYIVECFPGIILNMDAFLKKLVYMGYERAELVEGPGQFAVRGGIIDIFTAAYSNAIRIELWGDQIDSIRFIDTYTQRSVEKVDFVRIFPFRELVFGDYEIAKAEKTIKSEFKEAYARFLKAGLADEAQTLKESVDDALWRLNEQKTFAGADKYAPYFYPQKTMLLDYLPEDTIIFFDEPARIMAAADAKLDEFRESFNNRLEKGYALPGQINAVITYSEILRRAKGFTQVLLSTMAASASAAGFAADEIISFSVKSGFAIQNRIDMLFNDLHYLIERDYKLLILAGGKTRGERLMNELMEAGFPSVFFHDGNQATLLPGRITITSGTLSKGFEYPLIRLSVISGSGIFGETKRNRKPRGKKGQQIRSFTDLTLGDYVVHNIHGVGVYRGIEIITSEGISRDYIKISYSDGGNLFINTAQMDSLQKYIGGEGIKPKLSKLGSKDFAKAKARVKGAVMEIAGELTALYAQRETAKGYVYAGDTVWQREFEEAFPYDETDDQLNAIADVKADMESGRVMDRLICGDVGYGKTEVAIRAAFKTVMDGKQVACLVPTTILAQQHYNTFVQRMKDFPVGIELMSRFRTDKQQKESARKLTSGLADIVIGTHRLLSGDITFKNLGLIIVDEEQRFGVTHKEKLKKFRTNVNVLTLTATPIPRTLHMSLSGIRDMSVLDEPPLERIPIQTYVMEYDTELVREAIYRELSRGGQVYYLNNRIKNIADIAAKIAKLAPDASVAYAHGQMSEWELENVMMDFIEGEIDVLVCTTIIETGLDIQNVNTIIIQDADYMGLSQLYQLRGRVGRSNRIAYCYLMYRRDKVLTESSEKRLQTIREFTEFGAGHKIAMRDLSMRGAGNLLGAEQHGHMDSVGYEMYLKLLDEAVREYRGAPVVKEFETLIDIPVNAFIPSRYISDEAQKLDIYRRISLIIDEAGFMDMQEELEDRFGDLPQNVQNLLDIALLKATAHKLGAISVTRKGAAFIITFLPDAEIIPEKIAASIKRHNGRLYFTSAANPTLTYRASGGESGNIPALKRVLSELL